MDIGYLVKKVRMEKGITQQELCKRVGMKQAQLSHYETGLRMPKMDTLLKIANALECDVSELLPKDLKGRTDEEIERESEYRRAFLEYMGDGGGHANVGRKIKEYREKRGMTQQEFCDRIGMKQQQLSQYETGLVTPKMDTMAKMADALECSIFDLTGGCSPHQGNSGGNDKGNEEIKLMLGEVKDIYPGQIIRKIRKEKGITQQELCDRIGMKRQQLSMYENGVISPKMTTIERIADALECDALELLPKDLKGRTDEEIERESEYRRAFLEYMGEGGSNASVGEKIKEYREKRGMTQKQLCDSLGMKQQQLSQYETGIRTPSMSTINRIAGVLQCTVLDLAGRDVLDMLGGNSSMLYPDGENRSERAIRWMVEGTIDHLDYSAGKSGESPEMQVDKSARYKQMIQKDIERLNEKGLSKVKDFTGDIAKIEEYCKKNVSDSDTKDK